MRPQTFDPTPTEASEPELHSWESKKWATVLDRIEQIERRGRFLYDMLTRKGGGEVDTSLVGVPGVDPFLEDQAGRELDRMADRARKNEAARVESLRRWGKEKGQGRK